MIRNRRRRLRSDSGAPSNGTLLLSLSLYLMLLAFFIVLTSRSSFEEEKYKPVLRSLETAFNLTPTSAEIQPIIAAPASHNRGQGSVIDDMQALFTAQIPGFESATNKTQGVMHVRVSYKDIEKAVMTATSRTPVAEGRSLETMPEGFFLATLVALVKNQRAGQPYRMDMVYNVPGNPAALQNAEPQAFSQSMGRMSRLADTIEAMGLPRHLMSIGLGAGKADTVDITFRPHVPYNPFDESSYEQP